MIYDFVTSVVFSVFTGFFVRKRPPVRKVQGWYEKSMVRNVYGTKRPAFHGPPFLSFVLGTVF